VRGVGISDITDIADLQKFIYNCTSEIDQSIRLDSHPSLVKTPETQAGIGAGSIIHMPDNLDAGLKPYVLEFSGASVQSIRETISHTAEVIDKLANIGSVRGTESKTMSGVAMETEFQLLNARLSEKADNLELAEEQIWRIWHDYMGRVYEGSSVYPGSFNLRDTDKEINQLKVAKETATDPRVHREIDRAIVTWMGQDPDEVMPKLTTATPPAVIDLSLHATTTPETRSAHIQEMIMQGYTDAQILEIHPEITQADITSAKQQLLNLEE
jgi:hypothetical protein